MIRDNLAKVSDYADLRAYTGPNTEFYVTDDGIAGVFQIDPADTTSADNGGTVLVDVSGRRWKRDFSGDVNVKWFGAKGNGADDDKAAIQSAANAAAGRSLYLPGVSASYKISAAVSLQSNTVVYGDGRGSVIKLATGDIGGFETSGKTNVIVRDLTLLSEVAGTTAYIGGIRFYNSSKCTAYNVEMIGMSWAGVLLWDSSDCLVEACRFAGWLGAIQDSADVCIYKNSNHNVVRGNWCSGGGDHGVFVQDPYTGSTPTGNIIVDNTISAHNAYGVVVYVTTYYNTQTVVANNNIRDIVGSSVSGASGAGIYIQSAGGSVVSSNEIENCCVSTTNFGTLAPAGIGVTNLLAGTYPVVVSDNVIIGMTRGPGVFVNKTEVGVIVDGNVIDVNNASGSHNGNCIALTNVRRAVIVNNRLTQGRSDKWGVNMMASDTYTIEATEIRGNQIKSAGYGIGFNKAGSGAYVRSIVSGNNVEAADQAFALLSATDTVVDGNMLYSANTYPIVLSNSPKTRITNTKMIANTAGYGPLFSGTNTGSFMDRSCEWSKVMTNNPGNGTLIEQFGTSAPMGSGTWSIGDAVIQSVPAVGSPKGWRCTVSGSPGTWVSEGNL